MIMYPNKYGKQKVLDQQKHTENSFKIESVSLWRKAISNCKFSSRSGFVELKWVTSSGSLEQFLIYLSLYFWTAAKFKQRQKKPREEYIFVLYTFDHCWYFLSVSQSKILKLLELF